MLSTKSGWLSSTSIQIWDSDCAGVGEAAGVCVATAAVASGEEERVQLHGNRLQANSAMQRRRFKWIPPICGTNRPAQCVLL